MREMLPSPLIDAMFVKYANEVGGEYLKRDKYTGIVLTRVDNWTVIAELGVDHHVMRALYRSLDEFQFKVATKRSLHDLFGRIFGSKDIDVGDPELQERYSIESNDEEAVRRLLVNQTFRDLWPRCVHPAGHRNVIDRFETKRYKDAHEIHVDLWALWGLRIVYDLLVHTLRELADMRSASREHVEFPLGGDWEAFIKDAKDDSAWRKAEEQHFQRGSELGDEGKWREAIAEFDAVLELNPSHAKAHAQRGFAYAELGQRDDASTDLERAKALGDDSTTMTDEEPRTYRCVNCDRLLAAPETVCPVCDTELH